MTSLLSAKWFGAVILLLSIVTGVAGQLALKCGTTQNAMGFDSSRPLASAMQMLLNPYLLAWFFFGGISAGLWIAVVAKVELSFAYPVAMTLSFILILLCSRWLFGEMISMAQWIGIVLMSAGLFLAYRG